MKVLVQIPLGAIDLVRALSSHHLIHPADKRLRVRSNALRKRELVRKFLPGEILVS